MTIVDAARRALTIAVRDDRQPADEWKEDAVEINELAATAGWDVLVTHPVRVREARAATYLSADAVSKIQTLAAQCEVRQIIINRDLSVRQTRYLEEAFKLPLLDRGELILTIFARRAKSHEGKLQVELARCRRQMGRLAGLWTHLERQRGGIGLRGGPGEKQIELDRRLLQIKVRRLEKQIEALMKRKSSARKRRRKSGIMTAALVGYTNAGKSTLFNLLAGERVSARNRLFDTLDTTARRVRLPDGSVFILSDTVGFIRNLPLELVAGFRATLQDTADSDMLIIVADAAHPDWQGRLEKVQAQLSDIGVGDDTPAIIVMNKIDKAKTAPRPPATECGRIPIVYLSCKTKEGFPLLQQTLIRSLSARDQATVGQWSASAHGKQTPRRTPQ